MHTKVYKREGERDTWYNMPDWENDLENESVREKGSRRLKFIDDESPFDGLLSLRWEISRARCNWHAVWKKRGNWRAPRRFSQSAASLMRHPTRKYIIPVRVYIYIDELLRISCKEILVLYKYIRGVWFFFSNKYASSTSNNNIFWNILSIGKIDIITDKLYISKRKTSLLRFRRCVAVRMIISARFFVCSFVFFYNDMTSCAMRGIQNEIRSMQ